MIALLVFKYINLFILKALFHSSLFLCNIRSPQVFNNFYDVIVFTSSDFALVLGVESFEKQ